MAHKVEKQDLDDYVKFLAVKRGCPVGSVNRTKAHCNLIMNRKACMEAIQSYKGVTSQFLCNVPDVTLVPNFGRILVALLSNVKCSVMLWSDNRNIMDYWMFVARYCFKYVF